MKRALFALLAATVVACSSDPAPAAGRFDKEDSATPTRTDDDTASPGNKDGQPLEASDGGAPTAPSNSDGGTSSGVTTSCDKPHDLGSIAGDSDGSSVTAQGDCTQWLRIRANETDHGVLPHGMKLTATLVSPPGIDFDLVVYLNEKADTLECTTATGQSAVPASRPDVVEAQWGEVWDPIDGDDSRTVSIQVKAKDPSSCGKGTWALVLEGNK